MIYLISILSIYSLVATIFAIRYFVLNKAVNEYDASFAKKLKDEQKEKDELFKLACLVKEGKGEWVIVNEYGDAEFRNKIA